MQKHCTNGARGCKEQPIIDGAILKQAQRKEKFLKVLHGLKSSLACITTFLALRYIKHLQNEHHYYVFFHKSLFRLGKLAENSTETKAVSEPTYQNKTCDISGRSSQRFMGGLTIDPLSNTLNETGYGYEIKSPTIEKRSYGMTSALCG